MEKLKSSLLNMVISLTLVSMVLSSVLGFVYVSTKDKIEKAKNEKILKAIEYVLPEFNNHPLNDTININGMIFYRAMMDSVPVGYSVKVNSMKGYKGNITLMVGFLADGTINNICVLDQKETPGLGSRISDKTFIRQYIKKNLSGFNCHVKKDGGDVDALTGATISSRAFCDAVLSGYSSFLKNICKNDTRQNPGDTCNIPNESIIALVLPGFDNHPLEKPEIIDETVVYSCYDHNKLLGSAVKSSANGYHSDIWILAGFLPDRTINKVIVLKQSETEGMGAEVTNQKFLDQFGRQNPGKFKLTVKNDGGDVDAISGATISSRGFCDALRKAADAVNKIGNKNMKKK